MLWTPGKALEDTRYDRLTRMVRECVAGVDAGMRPIRSLVEVPLVRWYQPILFWKRDLDLSQADLSEKVLERVEHAVGKARLDLWDRGADSDLGFRVLDAVDITKEQGWEPAMGDIAIYLEWRGPKPSFWPHKLRAEDIEREKREDNAGMDKDYSDIVGKPWDEFMKDVRSAREGGNGS
jgi:hypothetical protein